MNRLKFDSAFLKNLVNTKYLVFAAYIAVAIFSLFIRSPAILVIFTLFPSKYLISISKKNFLMAVPLVVFVNLSILMVAAALMSLIKIPVSIETLIIFNVLLTSLLFVMRQKRKTDLVEIKNVDIITTLGIYLVFIVGLIARVFSVLGEQAAILHDPIAHAYWAKSIEDSNTIDYFYSPGIHVLILAFSNAVNSSFAQSTLFVTNFLSASAVLVWGIVAYQITKNRVFSLAVGLAIFALPFPNALYSAAGKNAIVVAITFAPLTFLFLHWLIERNNLKNNLLFCLSLIAMLIIHYPTGAFVIAISGVFILYSLFKNRVDSKYVKNLVRHTFLVGMVILAFSAIWMVKTNADRIRISDNQVTKYTAFDSQLVKSDEKVDEATSVKFHPRASLKSTYSQFASTYNQFGNKYLTLAWVSALIVLLLGYKKMYFSVLTIFITIFGICTLIVFVDVLTLAIVLESGTLLAFPMLGLTLAGAIALLWESSSKSILFVFLGVLIFGAIVFDQGTKQFDSFDRNTAGVNMIDSSDVSSFKWIENNIDPNAKILNDAQQNGPGSTRIFATTGASWIPAFTDNTISMPFQSGEYGSKTTHSNYESYVGLEQNFQESFCKLFNSGFRYYYYDSKTPYESPIDVLESVPNENRTLVYENEGVEIYEFLDAKGDCK